VELTATVHREQGSYWAEVRELPCCFASGDTLDELLQALEEAVNLYLAEDQPDARPQPANGDEPLRPVSVGELKLALS
jgi:predicted RNase H-like HicB family nuclease